ncbi:hypothetical protein ABZ863_35030 [Saccharomonospora sp. NPDC046836]|uniref:hypothetical protein n=1 Tax=Saccharomonospora sp. NPDC046836 TaxID=3156921 RepID=UPI0034045539
MNGGLRPDIAAKVEAAAETVREATCQRCGAPVLTGRAGRIAALDVIADPQPLTPDAERLALDAGRLTWCLTTTPHTPARIRWRNQWHAVGGRCDHTVIATHVCRPRPAEPVQETLL